MRTVLISTLLLAIVIIIISFMYGSVGSQIKSYNQHTGEAVKGEDFWEDYVTGHVIKNQTETEEENGQTEDERTDD